MITMRTVGAIPCPHDARRLDAGINYDHVTVIDPLLFSQYFSSGIADCRTCGRPFDLFEMVKATLSGGGPSPPSESRPTSKPVLLTSGALGLPGTVFQFEMQPGAAVTIDLGAHGIPKDARVLFINLTPLGPLFPALIRQTLTVGEALPHVLALVPWSFPGHAVEPTKVNALVLWVEDNFVAPSFVHVVDAYLHYSNSEFAKCVWSAQLALEEPFKDIVAKAFEASGVLPRAAERLVVGRRHGEIVEAILPALAEDLGIPMMPDVLRQAIIALMQVRNRASHKSAATISDDEALCGLTAAVFGVHYAVYFASRLKTV